MKVQLQHELHIKYIRKDPFFFLFFFLNMRI